MSPARYCTCAGVVLLIICSLGFAQPLFAPAGCEIYVPELRSLAVDDFNNDGNEDIAVLDDATGWPDLVVFLLQPTGHYQKVDGFSSVSGSIIKAGRFNNDNHQDLLALDPNYLSITVLLGNGDGSFGDTLISDLRPWQLTNVAIFGACGDLNNDGFDDLILGDYERKMVLHCLGNGRFIRVDTFSTQVALITHDCAVLGDFNEDGYLDFAYPKAGSYDIPDSVEILLNNRTGRFVHVHTYAMGLSFYDVDAADINQDGHLDLIAANQENDPDSTYKLLTIRKGTGQGTFGSPIGTDLDEPLYFIHPVDLNGQGGLDLVAVNFNQRRGLATLVNVSDTTFSAPTWQESPYFIFFAHSEVLTSADLNDDGLADVIFPRWTGPWGGVAIYYGNGVGGLKKTPSLEVGNGPIVAHIADFNGDQFDDLATLNIGDQSIGIILNDGTGNLVPTIYSTSISCLPYLSVPARLNNDAFVDLVVCCSTANSILALLSDGQGGFSSITTQNFTARPTFLAAADFDGDNAEDIAVCVGRGINVLLSDNAGYFRSNIRIDLTDSVIAIAAGRFNNDNDDDIALLTVSPDLLQWSIIALLGNGNGQFPDSARSDGPVSLVFRGMLAADLNEDGFLDLIPRPFTEIREIYLNDGTGHFDAENIPGHTMTEHGLATGDFNGDGHVDAAIRDIYNTVSVLSGNGAGSFSLTGYDYHAGYPHDTSPYLATGASTLAAGDFDNNGTSELIATSADTNRAFLLSRQIRFDHDVAVLAIIEPKPIALANRPLTPRAIVANLGNESESFNVFFHVGTVYTDTTHVSLSAGLIDTVSFSTWTPTTTGIFQMRSGTLLTGDENPANNTKTAVLEVADTTGGKPLIFSIRPAMGGNLGWVTTRITGLNFRPNATVKLAKSGTTDIVASGYVGQQTAVQADTLIKAVFNLKDAPLGLRDLIVVNPSGAADTLSSAFNVIPGTRSLWLDVVGPSEVLLPLRNQRRDTLDVDVEYTLYVGNNGNFDLSGLVLELDVPEWLILSALIDNATHDTLLHGDSLAAHNRPAGRVWFWISGLAPGQTRTYTFKAHTDWRHYPLGTPKPGAPEAEGPSIDFKGSLIESAFCFGKSLYASYQKHDGLTEGDFEQAAADALGELAESLFWEVAKVAVQILFPVTVPFIQAYDIASTAMSYAEKAHQLLDALKASLRVRFGVNLDPNFKVGPNGYGAAGWVTGNRIFRYEVHFENVDSATMPVQTVVVADTLDRDLDWSTLTMVSSKHELTNMQLDPSTGAVTWTFANINLPPNVNPPEGESWFAYTIQPDSGLATGTQIRNRAWIYFDQNDPESTRLVLNTIDNTPPQSRINELAPVQNQVAFEVSWSGYDSGSGIFRYEIYYSENGGEFRLWKITQDTSAIFVGRNKSSYSFFSLAIDNVGHGEPRPSQPDASTKIDAEEEIGVNPNPFVPSRGHTHITFFGGAIAYSTLKIYDKAGTLVRTLRETEGKSTLDWDATNDDGKKLASGVYIWVLSGHGLSDKGKFAIIR